MKQCEICKRPIRGNNNGFSDLLNNDERKKTIGIDREQTICIECKSILLYTGLISPY